ncbi:MAG: SpoIIE family protein phosphatase [Spirochaetota bacterium]
MGKSLQGAGGAIVFGASLKSQLMRYKAGENRLKLPELWLRDVFYDLQDIFASFDCSMLMSGIIGLVDLQNFTCYYLNAEHPYPVLWRDGKAGFLAYNHILKKVGTPQAFMPEFSIEVVKLQKNDVLILGSDGRDDILLTKSFLDFLTKNEVNIREIETTGDESDELNVDEKLFLKIVEIANGDIQEVSNIISKHSQTTDDFSLVSIKMEDTNKSALAPIPEEVLKKVSSLYRKREYTSALEALYHAFEKKPFDIFNVTLMNLLVKIYKKLELHRQRTLLEYLIYFLRPENERFLRARVEKNIKREQWNIAADFAEVLRIRYPDNDYYCILLARILYEKGNLAKAKELLLSAKVALTDEFAVEISNLEKLIFEKEKISKRTGAGKYSYWSKLFDFEKS